MKAIALTFVLLLVGISACQTIPSDDNATFECIPGYISIDGACVPVEENVTPVTPLVNETEDNTSMEEEPVLPEEPIKNETEDRFDVDKVLTAIEGDLIKLRPRAVDPDGDEVTYSYSKPFSSAGEWQTKMGDAGNYFVTVTASDGKLETKAEVLVKVLKSNKAPVLNCPESVSFKEGETVDLGCRITDPDGDDVTVTYEGWMNSAKKTTGYSDSGEYLVTVMAKDADNLAVEKTVKVIVENVDRAPVLESINDMNVQEGKLVKVEAKAVDPDGDNLVISYSDPLDANGEWQTKIGDAGTYTIDVTASDGEKKDSASFELTVTSANRAPVITGINDITVKEGETITLKPTVSDPEGNDVMVTYSGWMTSNTKDVSFDDSGKYQVTVTASDGKLESSKTITITVENVNRPPVFDIPA
ncbi:MAG: Ig-like domain-containing protein [Candidatus Woesearchaeota archaeon]